MRGHNLCFHWEIRKIISELSLLLLLIWSSGIFNIWTCNKGWFHHTWVKNKKHISIFTPKIISSLEVCSCILSTRLIKSKQHQALHAHTFPDGRSSLAGYICIPPSFKITWTSETIEPMYFPVYASSGLPDWNITKYTHQRSKTSINSINNSYYLSFRWLFRCWIHENPTIQKSSVDICYHGPDVSGPIWFPSLKIMHLYLFQR